VSSIGVFVTGCSDGTSSQAGQLDTVTPPVISEPVVLLHISDTHFGGDTNLSSVDGLGSDDPAVLQYDPKALMSTLIADIMPAVNPLATVHTGDMVNEGFQLKPWQSYQGVVANLSYPNYLEVPGNHDFKISTTTLGGKDIGDGRVNFTAYSKIGNALKTSGDRYGITRLNSQLGAVRLMRTNTAASPHNLNSENIDGYFNAEQKDALLNDSELNSPALLTVVLGHHPVTGKNKIATNNALMLELIANSKVNAPIYLCGHVHAPAIMWAEKTLVVQADTFGRHGQQSSFYLVGYDAGVASAKLVHVDATKSPSLDWPIVFITAPANSVLGSDNPNAKPYISGQPAPKLRTMVFSPDSATIASVAYSIDQGAWSGLNRITGRLWESSLPVQALLSGNHTVTVRATLINGQYGEDTISIKVQ
jgi:calcineurin-like phosphoesterase family protein